MTLLFLISEFNIGGCFECRAHLLCGLVITWDLIRFLIIIAPYFLLLLIIIYHFLFLIPTLRVVFLGRGAPQWPHHYLAQNGESPRLCKLWRFIPNLRLSSFFSFVFLRVKRIYMVNLFYSFIPTCDRFIPKLSYNVLKSMFKFNPNIFYNICQWKIKILLLLIVKFDKAALETLQNYWNSQFTHCSIIFHPSKSLTLFWNQFNFWLTSGPEPT